MAENEQEAMLETWAHTFKRWTFETAMQRHEYDKQIWSRRQTRMCAACNEVPASMDADGAWCDYCVRSADG